MTLRRVAARGVFWTALDKVGYQLATLVIFTILARILVPEAFGLVALATVFTSLLKIIADQGMADAIVQRPDLEEAHLDTAFWSSVGFGALLTALLAAAAWPLAGLLGEPQLAPVLAAMSAMLAISGFSNVQKAILTREFAFASLAVRSLAAVVIGGVIGVGAAIAGAGVWSLVAQTLTFELVSVITLWAASDWRPRMRFSRTHFKELLPFGASVVAFRAFRLGNTQIDNLMIGAFLGATALGFYVVAYRVLRLMINVTTAVVGAVAFPTFSRVQGDIDRVRELYYRTTRLAAVIAVPAFLGVVVTAEEVTALLFGPVWGPSVPVMQLLGFAGLVTTVTFLNSTVLKALGKPSWRVVIMGITAAAQVIVFSIVVRFGIRSVAIALTSVLLAIAPGWIYAVHKLVRLRFRTLARQFVSPALAGLLMVGAVMMIKIPLGDAGLGWQVTAYTTTGVVSYGAALLLVDPRLAREAMQLGRVALPGVPGRTAPDGHEAA